MRPGDKSDLERWPAEASGSATSTSMMGGSGRGGGELRPAAALAKPKAANGRSSLAVVELQGAGGAGGAGGSGTKIILRSRRRVIVLNEADVDWIDAAGNYIRFHAGEARHQVRGTLKEVEQLLSSRHFVRVHRSTIVNIESVREFVRTPYSDLIAVLHSGQRLAVGRMYRCNVEALLDTRL